MPTTQQKAPACAGARCLNSQYFAASVLRNNRATPAEAVVEADLHEVDGLLDVILEGDATATRQRLKRLGFPAEIEMVVLGLHRPVVGESVFDTNADHPAPAGRVGRLKRLARDGRAGEETVIGNRCTALCVEQGLPGSDTDPACERATSVLELLVRKAAKPLTFDPFRSVQLPSTSTPSN